jgi:hypothetical protein
MAFDLEVKYYNTFWLKQNTTPFLTTNWSSTTNPQTGPLRPSYVKLFPGIPFLNYTTNSFPNWPQQVPITTPQVPPLIPGAETIPYSNVYNGDNSTYSINDGSNWVVEESRIRGGYNNTQVDLGVRAHLMEDSSNVRYRSNALVYSGIFNSKTNINRTNVFSVGEDITKAVDPHNGSIQLIYAMDNNLTIFQENKVSQALIDKDAIYSAEGTPIKTVSNVVIGQVTPYSGEYGISRNPESFAHFGFRRYFADKDRNAVLRLSRDGITEISQYGMKDFFRDELAKLIDRKVITTVAFGLQYDQTTGVIVQGPQDSRYQASPPVAIPTPLGPWVRVVAKGINDLQELIAGSQVQLNVDVSGGAAWNSINSFVTGIGTVDISGTSSNVVFLDNGPLQVYSPGVAADPQIRFVYYEKDKIEGGFDNYKDNYTISIQQHSGSKTLDETSDYYNTLTFSERVQGWNTFYTYRPDLIFSLKNNYFTTKEGSLYIHYDSLTNANEFYGVSNQSSITFIFNPSPSVNKNFKTINYEGSNGWQVDSFVTDAANIRPGVNEVLDQTNNVKSYDEGLYTENGIPYRAGFVEKENKYYANLVNSSTATNREVVFGDSMTGVKGYFATVKMSTDLTTNAGGTKEMFAVSSEFVVSSR